MIGCRASFPPSPDEEPTIRGTVRGFRPSRLRYQRERAGLSLEGLGKAAGLAPSTIGHWETGARRPTAESLFAVAKALDISVADLIPIAESDLRPADLRNRVGLTQSAAADAVGISDSALGAIERGVREPAESVYPMLAQVYEVSVETLRAACRRVRHAGD